MKNILFCRFARYKEMNEYRKKASETTLMDGLRQRLARPRLIEHRHILLVALGSVALVGLAAFSALTAPTSAAHPAKAGDTLTLTFTVTVRAGTPPGDVLFWLCPDAKTDGTGCNEMKAQPDGSFTYQLTATTGTTYQHVIIEWSHGRLPTNNGPIPAPPAHITCDYHPFKVTTTNPRSFTCNADFTPATATPVPSVTTTPAAATTPGTGTPGSGDNSTLITGLQIVTGVGLALLLLLLVILAWQRMGARRG